MYLLSGMCMRVSIIILCLKCYDATHTFAFNYAGIHHRDRAA